MKRGVNHPVTDADLARMKALSRTMTAKEIGAECGFTASTVYRVLRGTGFSPQRPEREDRHPVWVSRVMAEETKLAFGYRKIYLPFHPRSAKDWVFEHRLVMERTLGRYLSSDEIVHHINDDRLDNRPENLRVVTKAWHQWHHMSTSRITDEEVARMLRAGLGYRELAERGVWQHRVSRIKKQLAHLDLLEVDPYYAERVA